jgi:hypothetical protein
MRAWPALTPPPPPPPVDARAPSPSLLLRPMAPPPARPLVGRPTMGIKSFRAGFSSDMSCGTTASPRPSAASTHRKVKESERREPSHPPESLVCHRRAAGEVKVGETGSPQRLPSLASPLVRCGAGAVPRVGLPTRSHHCDAWHVLPPHACQAEGGVSHHLRHAHVRSSHRRRPP